MARYSWYRPAGWDKRGPNSRPAIYFRDGVDDAFEFEAVLSDSTYGEMGLIWREADAEKIVAALNACGRLLT